MNVIAIIHANERYVVLYDDDPRSLVRCHKRKEQRMPDNCRICDYPLAGGECDNGCNQDAVIISLEDDFRGFMSRVFSDPDTVGIEQETEMRRAFMAGCWNIVTHVAQEPERLYQAKTQCWKFLEMVKAGRR